MKKLFSFILLLIISVLLLYLSLFLGELLVSILFLITAVLYVLYKKRGINWGVLSILLAGALIVLFSFNIIHKFDEILRHRYGIEQIYPIKPNEIYKSILISIENISKNKPINAAEIYLQYNSEEISIVNVKSQDQFLKITLSADVDKDQGTIYIAGGLPNPGYASKSALFAQVFLTQVANSKNDFKVGSKSRILANDGKGTDLSALTDGPYFTLNETTGTNTVVSEEIGNNRNVLNINGFASNTSKGRINMIARFFLTLNSKVLKK